jgi:hypothetical protein
MTPRSPPFFILFSHHIPSTARASQPQPSAVCSVIFLLFYHLKESGGGGGGSATAAAQTAEIGAVASVSTRVSGHIEGGGARRRLMVVVVGPVVAVPVATAGSEGGGGDAAAAADGVRGVRLLLLPRRCAAATYQLRGGGAPGEVGPRLLRRPPPVAYLLHGRPLLVGVDGVLSGGEVATAALVVVGTATGGCRLGVIVLLASCWPRGEPGGVRRVLIRNFFKKI